MTWDEEGAQPERGPEWLRDLYRQILESIRRNPGAWVAGAVASGATFAGIAASRRKKIFISFAVEDSFLREALRGQSLNTRTPFEFRDMGLDKPFTERWKTQCRVVIKECDGMIAIISKNTMAADGARWEMKCAVDEEIPLLGVRPKSERPANTPPELSDAKVIDWTWSGIADWIDSLG